MVQYRVFTGTIAEIETAFNGWAASLVQGVNINSGPLVKLDDGSWIKEVLYVLPVAGGRPNIALPTPAIARGNGRG